MPSEIVEDPEDLIFDEGMGFLWWDLLTYPSWVNRRVETFAFEDDLHLVQRVSIDVNTRELRQVVENWGLYLADTSDTRKQTEQRLPPYVYAPIALLSKKPELKLDLLDDRQELVSAASSRITNELAKSLFHAEVYLHMNSLAPQRVKALFDHIIESDFGDESLQTLFDTISRNLDGFRLRDRLVYFNSHEWAFVKTAMAYDSLRYRLLELSRRRFLVIPLYLDRGHHQVLKIKRNLPFVWPRLTRLQFLSRIGLRPMTFQFHAEGIGMGSRVHTRVVAPSDAEVVAGNLVRRDGEDLASQERSRKSSMSETHRENLNQELVIKPGAHYQKVLDEKVFVAYTRNLESGVYALHVQISPRFGDFFIPASIWAVLICLFSVTLFWLRQQAGNIPTEFGTAVTLLAALPAVFATLLIRGAEHGLVSRMHRLPRVLLTTPAILLILSAWFVSVSPGLWLIDTLLLSTGVLSGVSSLVFVLAIARNLKRFPSQRRI